MVTAQEIHDAIADGDVDTSLEWLRLTLMKRWSAVAQKRTADVNESLSIIRDCRPTDVRTANEWFGIVVEELEPLVAAWDHKAYARQLIDLHGQMENTIRRLGNDPGFDKDAYEKARAVVLRLFGIDPETVQ